MGRISSRIASKTTLNCESYFFSSEAIFSAKSPWVASTSLNRTKARTTAMLARTAIWLFSTLASINAPCSVNA